MNLYKIEFQHYAPKDGQYGMRCLLLANSMEEAYLFTDNKYNYGYWEDRFEEEEKFCECTKEEFIKSGGELYNEYELADLYYGQTVGGFSLVAENVNESDYQTLIDNKICFIYEE